MLVARTKCDHSSGAAYGGLETTHVNVSTTYAARKATSPALSHGLLTTRGTSRTLRRRRTGRGSDAGRSPMRGTAPPSSGRGHGLGRTLGGSAGAFTGDASAPLAA